MGKRVTRTGRGGHKIGLHVPPSSPGGSNSDSPNSMCRIDGLKMFKLYLQLRGDFQVLVNALQNKFSKRTKDQKAHFESELKSIVEKTVEALNEKVEVYEKTMSSKLNGLEVELGKITKEREGQVTEFERQYTTMKKSIESVLTEINVLDDKYNDTIKQFFATLKQYRTTTSPSRDAIKKLADEVTAETVPTSKRRRK